MREHDPNHQLTLLRISLHIGGPCVAVLLLLALLFSLPQMVYAQEGEFIVTKTDNDAVVAPGETVDYTIGYSYTNADMAGSAQFTETVPQQTNYITGSTGWRCRPDTSAGSHCTLLLPLSTASSSGELAFRVQVDDPLLAGTTQIDNSVQARLSSQGEIQLASDSTPIATANPALSLTNSDGDANVVPGDSITYALNYSNNGATAATGVVLRESIPPNTTVDLNSSTAGWNCTGSPTCVLNLNTLAPGAFGTANFVVVVDNPVSAGVTQISNSAILSATNSDPESVEAVDTTPVTAAPVLGLTKSDSNATAGPGDTITYTLNYQNTGNQNAGNTNLQETVPNHTTFNQAASAPGWSCAANAPQGTPCTLNIGTLNGGGSGSALFVVNVINEISSSVDEISNSATLNASNASSVQASDTTPVVFPPQLTFSKSDGNISVVPGGVITYTLNYGNTGDETATGVSIQEQVPANSTFVGPIGQWLCLPGNGAGSTCTHVVGSLAGGATGSVQFRVQVNSPVGATVSQIDNSANISGNNVATVNASDTTPVIASPQLALTKSDGDITTTPGSVIIYTLSYTNSGNKNVVDATLQETVPANTTFDNANSTPGWNCSAGTCTFTVGAIGGNGGSGSVTFAVRVANSVPAAFTSVQNMATLNATGTTSVQASDTTPVNAAPALSLTKTATTAEVEPGNTLNYTLNYTNTGNQEAIGLVLTETVPKHTTFQGPAGWSCVPDASADSTCTFNVANSLNGGGSGSTNFNVRVVDTVAATVNSTSNSAFIEASNASSASSNVLNTAIGGDPQLDIDIDDILPAVAAGGFISYTVDYSNRGGREALGTEIEIEIPNNTTFSATNSSAGWNCADESCTYDIGSLEGQSDETQLLYTVRANDPLPVGLQRIEIDSTIRATNAPQDDSDSESTYVKALIATKSDEILIDADNNGTPSPGDTLRYEVGITNGGGQTLSNVIFSDTPDSNSTLVVGSVTTSAGTVDVGNDSGDTKVEVDLDNIRNNVTVIITFDVKIKSTLPVGVEEIANQGVVLSDQLPDTLTDDPDTQQENDTTLTSISSQAVIKATKRDELVNDADNNGFPSTGDIIEYQVEIVNSGNQSAVDIVLNDVPDNNTALVANSVTTDLGTVTSGNDSGDTAVTVEIDQLTPKANATITFRVRIKELLPGVRSIRNQGTVTRNAGSASAVQIETDDPDTIVPDDETVTQLSVSPVLYASKTAALAEDADGDGLPGPGDTLRYQVVIVNSGNLPASGVTFDDTLDENTTLLTGSVNTSSGIVTSGNTVGDTTISVAIGAIAGEGSSVTISYEARINATLTPGTISVQNQGIITSNELPAVPTDDPNTSETEDPTVTSLTADQLLIATQTDSLFDDADGDGVPSPGDTILLEVRVRNSGSATATGVGFRNPIDDNLQLVADSVQTNQGAVVTGNSPGDSVVEIALGSLPGGSLVTISFQVTIDDPLGDNIIFIESQGTISSTDSEDVLTDDPDIIGTADPTVINLSAGPLLQVVKTDLLFVDADSDGLASSGDTLFYRITLVNNGNAAATDIVLEDTPDAYSTLVNDSIQTDGGTVVSGNAAGDQSVFINVGDLAGNGNSTTISLRVTVNEVVPVDTLINQAMVTHTDFNVAGGQAVIMSDDPDTPEKGDATLTPVVRNATLFGGQIFLPITAN